MDATITIPSIHILNGRWPYFRSLPLQLKALGAIIVVFPTMSIFTEYCMLDFEHSQLRWGTRTMKEKFVDWAARHKLNFVVGSWVVTMTTAGAIIMRGPWVLYFPFAPCVLP